MLDMANASWEWNLTSQTNQIDIPYREYRMQTAGNVATETTDRMSTVWVLETELMSISKHEQTGLMNNSDLNASILSGQFS